MRNPFGQSIAGRLRLYSVGVILPLVILGGMLLYDYWVVLPAHALSDAMAMAEEGSHQLDDFVVRTGKVLGVLSHMPEVEGLRAEPIGPFLQHLSEQYPEYDSFSVADSDGVIIASARPELIGFRMSDGVRDREAVATGQMAVSDVITSRTTGQSAVLVSYPITTPLANSVGGLVVATIDLAQVPGVLSRLTLRPEYRMTVFDRQGQVVFHAAPPQEEADFAQCSQCHSAPVLVRSPAEPIWERGGQFHAISSTGLGWRVIVTAPSGIVLGSQQRNAWMVLLVVLVVLAGSVVVGDITGRRLARPILRLAQAARRFGAGEQVAPLAVAGRDEVGVLTQSFNAMVKEIGDGRRRQEKQQARLHTLWELDLAVSSTLSLPGVLDILADEIQRHGSVTGMAIYLLDDANALAPVMSRGIARPLVTGRGEHKLGDLAQEVLQGSSPVLSELDAGLTEGPTVTDTIACFAVPLASKGRTLGAILFCARSAQIFTPEEQEFLYGVGLQASTAVENARLYGSEQSRVSALETLSDELKRQRDELQRAQEGIVETLNLALQAKDPYTRGHAERVGLLARRIAARLGLPRERQEVLARAARLHDIGKINIPEHLLSKEGGLTPPERTQFELHPERSAELLRHLPDLDQVLPAIRGHHERYDGKGYPDGLAGAEIPLEARIIAVADAYDALTTNRPYRDALSHEEALEVLRRHAGTQWDAEVVEVLLDSFKDDGTMEGGKQVSPGLGESRQD